MKLVVKSRLLYIGIAIVCYILGFQFMPNEVDAGWQSIPVIVGVIGYFGLLPLMYWLLVIKVNNQKSWKLIFVYSISSLMAYYSFPSAQAVQFDFILLLRYPILFVIGVIEFYVLFGIVKGLWKCRNLKGDPRVNIINEYKHEDEKKRSMAVMFATELTSWFYAIPYFSRKQGVSDYQINLLSGTSYHWVFAMIALGLVSWITFTMLVPWSEIGAYFISGLIFYSVVLFTANYRVSRYYSLYVQDGKLVVNNSIFGFLLVNLEDIALVSKNEFSAKHHELGLCIGSHQDNHIEISFKEPQNYYGGMGMLPEKVDKMFLNMSHVDSFIVEINQFWSMKVPQDPMSKMLIKPIILDEHI